MSLLRRWKTSETRLIFGGNPPHQVASTRILRVIVIQTVQQKGIMHGILKKLDHVKGPIAGATSRYNFMREVAPHLCVACR